MMNVNELLAIFVTGNCVKNRSFSLRAKAFDVAHFAGLARRAQIFDVGNPQLFLKTSDFLNRQTGYVRKLDDARRKLPRSSFSIEDSPVE